MQTLNVFVTLLKLNQLSIRAICKHRRKENNKGPLKLFRVTLMRRFSPREITLFILWRRGLELKRGPRPEPEIFFSLEIPLLEQKKGNVNYFDG